ncbi:MAG: universal stress protein [Longimicrobiaceae bacterium]
MTDRIPVIVAGVSELQANDPTLLVATEVARAAGAELHLVHTYQLPPVMAMPAGTEVAFPEGYTQYADLLLESLRSAARALPGGEAAKCRVILGPPGPTLASFAAHVHADLLIVGAARGSRLGRTLLGTTAQRVLREAKVPVLVARRPVTPLRRVLLTTDLSPLSGAVHDTALQTIETFFGTPERVRSLMVLGWLGIPEPLTPEALDRAACRELEAFLHARANAGHDVEPVVRSGITADEIVDEALDWGADLVVVGTHARGWGARMMLGSVAEAALRDAPCNVLAVPPIPVVADAAPGFEPWREAAEPAEAWLGAGI